jgi:C-terminal processing protease CtpA/Prc
MFRHLAIISAALVAVLAIFLASPLLAQADGASAPLTVEERLYGLSLIWKEASYNFAFFDRVPELDWDEAYRRFIPEVTAASSEIEYYDQLMRFCALLRDGHTRIFPPQTYRDLHDRPNVLVLDIEGQAVIAAVGESLKGAVPVGSSIVEVDGLRTDEYLESNLIPAICASTEEFRREVGIIRLLEGPAESDVSIGILTPSGETRAVSLKRNSRDLDEPKVNTYPRTDRRLESRRLEGGIVYIALNTFADPGIVGDFEVLLPELRGSAGIVLDLRRNGGGESDIGYAILAHLIDEPATTYRWKTRVHCAAYKAWGKWTSEFPPEELADLDAKRKEYLEHYRGDAWREGGPDTIRPAVADVYTGPIAVLIGPMTGSAAEDFLVALGPCDRAVFIGRRTAGFTGTPLIFDLPGGGLALINTTREMFADGTLIQNGIEPDIEALETVQDVIDGNDPALNAALSFCTGGLPPGR